jgi:hypothetical protein
MSKANRECLAWKSPTSQTFASFIALLSDYLVQTAESHDNGVASSQPGTSPPS